jgi:multiple sugar transport system substrate-binding protein
MKIVQVKTALLSLSALLLAGSALAADPAFPKAPAGKVTLEVWSWVPGLDKTVTAFEKAYPNIDVKVTNLGGGPQTYTKLLTTLKAGTGAPDVAQVEYGFVPSFVDTGGLADLSTRNTLCPGLGDRSALTEKPCSPFRRTPARLPWCTATT